MLLSAASSVGITGRYGKIQILEELLLDLQDVPGYWILQTGDLKHKRCMAVPWPEE